jgi:hypothetical protein
MTKEEILKGLKCCVDYECSECPYQKFDHVDYKLRCMHMLIVDLHKIIPEVTWSDIVEIHGVAKMPVVEPLEYNGLFEDCISKE